MSSFRAPGTEALFPPLAVKPFAGILIPWVSLISLLLTLLENIELKNDEKDDSLVCELSLSFAAPPPVDSPPVPEKPLSDGVATAPGSANPSLFDVLWVELVDDTKNLPIII